MFVRGDIAVVEFRSVLVGLDRPSLLPENSQTPPYLIHRSSSVGASRTMFAARSGTVNVRREDAQPNPRSRKSTTAIHDIVLREIEAPTGHILWDARGRRVRLHRRFVDVHPRHRLQSGPRLDHGGIRHLGRLPLVPLTSVHPEFADIECSLPRDEPVSQQIGLPDRGYRRPQVPCAVAHVAPKPAHIRLRPLPALVHFKLLRLCVLVDLPGGIIWRSVARPGWCHGGGTTDDAGPEQA
jgi:hypothetical protein